MNCKIIAKRLSIEGIVQGVGFRPFIYQLAQKHDLTGYILNTVAGVSITVEGLSIDIASFLTALLNNPPPLAYIIRHESRNIPLTGFTAFTIRESRLQSHRNTLVSPDISVCSDKGINVPMTSSMGRLFDGIAALIGLRTHITFEGQAAMDLTAIATAKPDAYYAFEWSTGPVYRIPIEPLIKGGVEDLSIANTTASVISTKFHNTLAHLFTALCDSLRKEYKLNTIVLSGGVFQNMLLGRLLIRELSQNSFDVYAHQTVPTNDGGLSLGQAIVAASQTQTIT